MSDTPPVPPVPPVPPTPGVPPVEPPPAAVAPPAPPVVPEPARPDPYAQPNPYAQPAPTFAQPAYGQPGASPYAPQYGYGPRTNPLAIVSLVLSLVAVFVWFLGSLGAVICGHIALNQIKRTGEGGRGLALAGVIIGYVGLGLTVIFVIVYALIIAAAVSTDGYNNF